MINLRAKFLIPIAASIVLISSSYLAFFFDRSNIIVGLTVTVFITSLGIVLSALLNCRTVRSIKLKETTDFLANIIESLTDSIVTTDMDGKITFANAGSETIFGYGKGETIGTHISQYYAGGLREAKRIGKIIRKEGKLHFGEIDFLRKDRTIVTLSMSYDLLRDNEGRRSGIVAVGKDVTEEKRIERELIQTKDSLESLIEGIMDPMVTTDKKGLVTYINKGLTEILGYEKEDAIGKHISSAYPGGMEEAKKLMGLLKQNGKFHGYETQFIKKDGSLLYAIVCISLLRDKSEEVIGTIGICKDISERKTMEIELEKLSITDNLTGLYNQRHFYNELGDYILDKPISMCYVYIINGGRSHGKTKD